MRRSLCQPGRLWGPQAQRQRQSVWRRRSPSPGEDAGSLQAMHQAGRQHQAPPIPLCSPTAPSHSLRPPPFLPAEGVPCVSFHNLGPGGSLEVAHGPGPRDVLDPKIRVSWSRGSPARGPRLIPRVAWGCSISSLLSAPPSPYPMFPSNCQPKGQLQRPPQNAAFGTRSEPGPEAHGSVVGILRGESSPGCQHPRSQRPPRERTPYCPDGCGGGMRWNAGPWHSPRPACVCQCWAARPAPK